MIDKFQPKTAVLLYTTFIQCCERAIKLFVAAGVSVIIVRSKVDQEDPEDLDEIMSSESRARLGKSMELWNGLL